MATKVLGYGPKPAKIMLVGEAPGAEEEKQVRPFVGSSGSELSRMLNEAGILRTECYVTNVCKYRPPANNMEFWWPKKDKNGRQAKTHIKPGMIAYDGDYMDPRVAEGIEELKQEVAEAQPNIIVPLGNLPLWALTRNMGITKWRSSLLHSHKDFGDVKVVPTIHPAAILRKWDWRYLAVHDLRRVARWSHDRTFPTIEERFSIRPTFLEVRNTLDDLMRRADKETLNAAVDIETRSQQIACIGIAWSRYDAICIPFLCVERPDGYWSTDEEVEIILRLRDLLTHRNVQCIGQNWQYDYQYLAKYWQLEVNLFLDIMSEHHVQFPGLPKGLDFQSSLYRDVHIYWKDESKEWTKGEPEDTLWTYNCRDAVATYEIAEVLLATRKVRGLRESPYGSPFDIQQALSTPMARASARGVRVNHDLRRVMAFVLQEDIREAEEFLHKIVGFPLNVASPKQMYQLFYEDLKVQKILARKTRRPTLNADALEAISKQDVLIRPLCHLIAHIRSLHNSFAVCLQPLAADGRLRCQYTIPGTETYRFASSSDPFGCGMNLQNITSGEEEDKDFPLPNLRRLFIPDPGHAMGEFDLPQADARVVAWEAEDEELIALFEDPSRHLHKENSEVLFGKVYEPGTIQYYHAKQGVHLTNYGGTSKVLAMTLGITVHEADKFQNRWFSHHPKIREWHRKIEIQLATRRYVENAFGFRRFYFDRVEGLLKEALAWIPQSTVSIATNLGILLVDRDIELQNLGVRLLLQTHDSSNHQWPLHLTNLIVPKLVDRMTIKVPYPYPLLLRPEAKISDKSWGDLVPYDGNKL